MIEFDVDIAYLLEEGGLDRVVLNDENGEYPSMLFEPSRGECHIRLRDDIRGNAYQDVYECSECGEQVLRETVMGESEPPNYCPHCGAKAVEQ